MSDIEEAEVVGKEKQESIEYDISDLKKQKRIAKSLLTRLLTQLSCLLSEEKLDREQIW